MEAEYKSGGNGLESGRAAKANRGQVKGWDFILRFLALALTLTAAVVLGVDSQTTSVTVTLISSLPPVTIPVTAKWHDLSAFVFFVVANAVACAYAAVSLILTLANRGEKKPTTGLAVGLADLLMVALLFSAIGAAMAIGILGYEGNSHVQWKKVCTVFGRFCGQGVAALTVSLAGAFVFFLLAVIANLSHHRKG